MNVSLNLKPCQVPDELETFIDLLLLIEKERIPKGEVITRIVLDGEELDEQMERDAAEKHISEIEMVEFYSAKTIDLAQEGLEYATELLPSLIEDMPNVARELRAGNEKDGLEMFSECVSVISWYVQLVNAMDLIFTTSDPSFRLDQAQAQSAEDLTMDVDLAGLGDDGVGELKTFASIENFRQKLMDIERAQHNQDTKLLADLVEFEMLPIIKLWSGEVPLLLTKIKHTKGGEA